MSFSSFSQYYFGVVDRLLLTADQRGYIQDNAQTITLLLNTVACVVLISLNCTIQFVKLSASVIYLLRPIVLRWYVNRHYSGNRDARFMTEPIRQMWNGVAQHVLAVVLDSTDVIFLTLFSTLTSVSIYSVYFSHIRFDLCEAQGKVYFVEYTFFHFVGMVPFNPIDWDTRFGKLLTLPSK